MSTYLLGVDVGGTHTDVCVAANADIFRGKALTTHGKYSDGILEAISATANGMQLSRRELLADTSAMVNGTTIVTNAITELSGARVGVILTGGFRDTFRLLGGARQNVYDDHLQVNPPEIVPRECIVEIEERIDSSGRVIVPIQEADVRAAVRQLRTAEVETLAVCFLWSFKNPTHEKMASAWILDEWPGALVSLSSEIHPKIREHRRYLSAFFNAFCQPATVEFVDSLESVIRKEGLSGDLSFFTGEGGAISGSLAKRLPILLLASGPAGGVMAATHLAGQMGYSNVITADMGGTSFDTSLIERLEPATRSHVSVGPFETGMTAVDVISIGAGGGSIAWVDGRGVPQVGPRSAGSFPGPACYARGGTLPTVTDAAVVLGLLDVDNYLGGRVQLDGQAAAEALERVFREPFGWSAETAAKAVTELVTTNMAYALRQVSLERRGIDPRTFSIFAYGGMLPLFATAICSKLGVRSLIVPRHSSVYCAMGVLVSDYLRRHSRTVEWHLDDRERIDEINEWRSELLREALFDAESHGFAPERCELAWGADVRFEGQTHEIPITMEDEQLSEVIVSDLVRRFPSVYEDMYGPGTAWRWSKLVMANLTLTLTARRAKPKFVERFDGAITPEDAKRGSRAVFDGREWVDVSVLAEERVPRGTKLAGPVIIDEQDSTIFVERSWTCTRDRFGSFILESGEI